MSVDSFVVQRRAIMRRNLLAHMDEDERAMEEYLVSQGLEGATLRLASGEVRAGADQAGDDPERLVEDLHVRMEPTREKRGGVS